MVEMRQLKQVGGFELGVQNIEERCGWVLGRTTGGVTLLLPNARLSSLAPQRNTTQQTTGLNSSCPALLIMSDPTAAQSTNDATCFCHSVRFDVNAS